jgi:hypothetical protein
MDIVAFIVFSFNTRYIMRWILPGLILFIPVVNFLSLGYLARASNLTMVGGMGMPTWERKNDVFKEGARLIYIVILYEALPCFLFSFAFLLHNLNNIITTPIAYGMYGLSFLTFVICSFFLPFAFSAYIEGIELRKAFEFESIARAVKEVFFYYLIGYVISLIFLYVAYKLHAIPYLIGFIVSSVLIYLVLLVSTYYFTQLFKKTSLSSGNVQATIE